MTTRRPTVCLSLVVLSLLGAGRLDKAVIAAKPMVRRPKPELPSWWIGQGKKSHFYPKLVKLGSLHWRQVKGQSHQLFVRRWTVPSYQKATQAAAGLYASYYNYWSPASPTLGLAVVDGQAWPAETLDPTDPNRGRDRVLVLVRRRPKRGDYNCWYLDPAVARDSVELLWANDLIKERRLTESVAKRLGFNRRRFNLVTMQLNRCVEPSRWCFRCGLFASPESLSPFYQDRKHANQEALLHLADGRTLLVGDGGNTIGQANEAMAPLGLFFYRFKSR